MKLKPLTLYNLYEENKESVGGFTKSHIIPMYKKGRQWVTILLSNNRKVVIYTEDPTTVFDYDMYKEDDNVIDYVEEADENELKEILKDKDIVNKLFNRLFKVMQNLERD
jgi:hypothetical protein